MTLQQEGLETTRTTSAAPAAPTTHRVRDLLGERAWARWALAAAAPVAFALLAAWWTPRGPMTTAQALSAMALGLLAGACAGLIARSRWAILLAPVAFVAVFEVARAGYSGPTVDGIHVGTIYGLMALTLGRGVHGLLALLPMALGAVAGAALARRRAGDAPARSRRAVVGLWARRGVAGLTAVALLALAVLVARPATTDPIVDAAGDPVAGSIAELTRVDVGDHDLGLMLRGRSTDNPVLLFLAGGPGGSELGAMRRHSSQLEDSFVVATLDQRGTGTSYGQIDPTDTLTLDDALADALAVTEYLRDRFGQQRIYLVGQSWGTLLGVLMLKEQPDAFAAYVGVGQMVSPTATDRIFYDDTLAWARRTGDDGLVDTLVRNGPPPYTDIRAYEAALSYEHELYPYDRTGNSEGAGQMGENLFVEEYALLDTLRVFPGFLDVFATLYPRIQDVDLRERAATVDVPVYLALGAHEAPGRALPAREWFDALQAPRKELRLFDTSGHRPLWEQPEQFADLMADVLAQTSAR
jgi:proline iminopeptidase